MSALGAAAAASFLAAHHPLWPWWVLGLLWFWVLVVLRWRGAWLFVLPAALPWLNFSPWTGWIAFDEFDLLVLGAIAGAWLHRAARGPSRSALRASAAAVGMVALLVVANGVALWRGMADAGWSFEGQGGYVDAVNSLRVAKPLFYAVLLWWPLLWQLQESTEAALRRLGLGILFGLTVVCIVAVWERAAFPGLWNFSEPYRVTALFWEMHVGGAAIDAYLAMATPFVAWGLWRSRSPAAWGALVPLALAAFYACLTTFSRGVYLSVAVPLLLLGLYLLGQRLGFRTRVLLTRSVAHVAVVLTTTAFFFGVLQALGLGGVVVFLLGFVAVFAGFRRRFSGWRHAAALGLLLALLVEAVVVLGAGNFMLTRLANSERDFGRRLVHWQHGLGLFQSPAEWAFGIGLGRLPARYVQASPEREFSGSIRPIAGDGLRAVRISGPGYHDRLGGLYSLTQRLGPRGASSQRVSLDVRVDSVTDVLVSVCETHLLYDGRCRLAEIRLHPGDGILQHVSAGLEGPSLQPTSWYAPRPKVFAVSVLNVGGAVEVDQLRLLDEGGVDRLKNGDFSDGMAHWLPVAQYYFLPWHIDNLYLELLIERGLVGLALFLTLMMLALRNLNAARDRYAATVPFLAASLIGALLVGTVSSLMDVPRVTFLFLLITLVSLLLPNASGAQQLAVKRPRP